MPTILLDNCSIATMKEEIVKEFICEYSLKSELKRFMGLNKKLEYLPISLRFWIRLVLSFVIGVSCSCGD